MILTENFHRNIKAIDLIVFDIDGVLIDTSESFPAAIVKSVYRYGELKEMPNWKKPTRHDVAAFKRVPGFNNDWDLAEGLLAFQMLKTLNGADTNLSEYLTRIEELGSGLAGVRKRIQQSQKLKEMYKSETIRQLAQEYYAGEKYCEQLYGFEPEYGVEVGTMETETLLVEVNKLNQLAKEYKLGIYTGRDPDETDVALKHIGFSGFTRNCIATDDGEAPTKPNPVPFNQMLEEVSGSGVLFIGDSRDDYATIINFRETYPDTTAEFVQVSEDMEPFEQGTNVVRSVNDLLNQLIHTAAN